MFDRLQHRAHFLASVAVLILTLPLAVVPQMHDCAKHTSTQEQMPCCPSAEHPCKQTSNQNPNEANTCFSSSLCIVSPQPQATLPPTAELIFAFTVSHLFSLAPAYRTSPFVPSRNQHLLSPPSPSPTFLSRWLI